METYALQEQLFSALGSRGSKYSYELKGVTGSRKVAGYVVDVVVMSVDGKVSVELLNVRTVEQISVAVSHFEKRRHFKLVPFKRH